MKFHLNILSAVPCMLLFASAVPSHAQSAPWPGFQVCSGQITADISGDASFNVFGTPSINDYVTTSGLRNPLFSDWDTCTSHPGQCGGSLACILMGDRCFGFLPDGSGCSNDFSNPECGARRILNTMVLMKKIPMNASVSWFDHVANESSAVYFNKTCDQNGLTDGTLSIHLYSGLMFNQPLIRRASTVAHEAGHADNWSQALHCGPLATVDCECPGSEVSCDERWNWGLSTNRRAVEFIELTLAHGQQGVVSLPPFVWYDAYQAANQILDGRFQGHPGFNLVPRPGSDFVYGQRKHWSFVSSPSGYHVETSVSGRELVDGATAVIQGIFLTTKAETTDDLRVCATMRKYEAENAIYGLDANARDISGVTVIPGQTDPEDFGNPGCARRELFSTPGRTAAKVVPPVQTVPRQMGIVGLRARTNGAGDMREMQADYQEIDRGAAVGPVTTVSSHPGAPAGSSWDVWHSSPIRGGFLTGVGFGAKNGVLNAMASNWSLGPELETRAGGNGGSTNNPIGACPVNTVPIGVAAKAVPSPYGTLTVGYFSLVCAPDVWLSGTNANQRTYVRASFVDTTVTPNVTYSDGVFSGVGSTTPHPPNTTTVTCPMPHTLEGMTVRHGAEVDQIVSILCSQLSTVANAEQATLAVGVGGPGGQLLEQNCRKTPGPSIPPGPLDRRKTMAPFFWYRSGWRLDGIALGCYPNLHDIENFEINDGVFGRDTHLIDMQNGMDVAIGENEPNDMPDMRSHWVDVSKIDSNVPQNPPAIRRRLAAQGYGTGGLVAGERWPPVEWQQQPEGTFGGAEPNSVPWHERWFSAIARSLNPTGVPWPSGTVRIFERAGIDLRHLPASTGTATVEFRYFMEGPNRGGLRLQARPRTSTIWQTLWIFQDGVTANSGLVHVNLITFGYRGAMIDLRMVATTGVAPTGNIVVDGFRLRTGW